MGFDCGHVNMGAAILKHKDGKTSIDRLHWGPLIGPGGKVDITSIACAVSPYLTELLSLTTPVDKDSSSGVSGVRMRDSFRPNLAVIEQQVARKAPSAASNRGNETNFHALSIQAALLAIIKDRFPDCVVKSVGASARRSTKKAVGKQKVAGSKERATFAGTAISMYDSPQWYSYLMSLRDRQHTCDALTMAADAIGFNGLDEARSQVIEWEKANGLVPMSPFAPPLPM